MSSPINPPLHEMAQQSFQWSFRSFDSLTMQNGSNTNQESLPYLLFLDFNSRA
jgi:hypothetical protein